MATIKRNPDQLRRSAAQVRQLGDQMTSARNKLDAAVAPARRGDVPELGQIDAIYSSLKTRMTRTNMVFDRSANTMRGYAALTEAQERMNAAWLAAIKAPKGVGRSRSANRRIAGDAWALDYARRYGLVPPGNSAADWARWSTLMPKNGSASAVGSWSYETTMTLGGGYLAYLQYKHNKALFKPVKTPMTTGYGLAYTELTGRDHYTRPFNSRDYAQWLRQRDSLARATKYADRIGAAGDVWGGIETARSSYTEDRELGYSKKAAVARGTVRGGSEAAGAIAGATYGGTLGGTWGAGLGTMIAPGPGTVVGGFVGGVGGGIVGGIAGSAAGQAVGEGIVDSADWASEHASDAYDGGKKKATQAAKKVGGWLTWD